MSSDLATVITVMRRGGIVIYPTETAYALGCDAMSTAAVRKIFLIKGREKGKPLPLIVASMRMAEQYARFGLVEKKLAKKHWPGALTLVVMMKNHKSQNTNHKPRTRASSVRGRQTTNHKPQPLSPGVVGADGTVAMRVSSHPIARALSRALGRPIVATSANKSGARVAYTVKDALRSLGRKNRGQSSVRRTVLPNAVIDAGRLPKRKPSTVVRVSDEKVEVLRKGAITLSPSP